MRHWHLSAAEETNLAAQLIKKGGPNLGSLLGAFVLSLTVVTVVAIGIIVAFGAVILILHAVAPDQDRDGAKPVFVRAAHAGGD
jgi:hypothetical protein